MRSRNLKTHNKIIIGGINKLKMMTGLVDDSVGTDVGYTINLAMEEIDEDVTVAMGNLKKMVSPGKFSIF